MDSTKYFAAVDDADELLGNLYDKITDYYEYVTVSGTGELWRKSNKMYHDASQTGGAISETGTQGEYSSIGINHYRNIMQHMLVMTTSQRPAFEPRSTNTDVKSQSQTILATGLLDYYMREKRLERHLKGGVELCLIFGEGFVAVDWDSTSGEAFNTDPETKSLVYTGDLVYSSLGPIDVIRDHTRYDKEQDWVITRTYKNKFDLAAKYTEFNDELVNLPNKTQFTQSYISEAADTLHRQNSDLVPVYTFYHKPSPVLPEGMIVVFTEGNIMLQQSGLPFRSVPVYRIAPQEALDKIFGYTIGWDLLPIQEAINGLYSTILTNQTNFGVQNISVPIGVNTSVQAIAGGMNLVYYEPNQYGLKPEGMNLTTTPAEIFNFLRSLEQLMETLSGINSVARGNPEASLKSGAALALVQSMAIAFSMGLQQSYAQLLEDVGTATINILRDFAKAPRIAMIAGKSSKSMMREFTGDDLSQVNRVVVDMGNPLTRTTAGKVNLAETLLKNNLISNAEQYIAVLTTGKLEPLIEGTQAELLLIRSENEALQDGQQVTAIITDEHSMHILEHKAVLASPQLREDPTIVQATLDHMMQHIELLKSADPALMELIKQKPLSPQISQTDQGQAGAMLNPTNPVTQEASEVAMPKLPESPL